MWSARAHTQHRIEWRRANGTILIERRPTLCNNCLSRWKSIGNSKWSIVSYLQPKQIAARRCACPASAQMYCVRHSDAHCASVFHILQVFLRIVWRYCCSRCLDAAFTLFHPNLARYQRFCQSMQFRIAHFGSFCFVKIVLQIDIEHSICMYVCASKYPKITIALDGITINLIESENEYHFWIWYVLKSIIHDSTVEHACLHTGRLLRYLRTIADGRNVRTGYVARRFPHRLERRQIYWIYIPNVPFGPWKSDSMAGAQRQWKTMHLDEPMAAWQRLLHHRRRSCAHSHSRP